MALSFAPITPFHLVASVLGIGFVLGCLAAIASGRWNQWSQRSGFRWCIGICSVLAVLAMVVASWNPILVEPPNHQHMQVAVLLDVSQSVQQGPEGWKKGRQKAEKLLRKWVGELPGDYQEKATAAIFTLQSNASMAVRRHALKALPQKLAGLDPALFASGDGTNLAAGLERVSQWFAKGKGQGVCLLVSDGHQTQGDVLKAAEKMVAIGVPVHVIPINGGGASLDWIATDLPQFIGAGAPTHLRGLLRNGTKQTARAQLELSVNGGEGTNADQQVTQQLVIEPNGWRRVRWPITLENTGVQYVDLRLKSQAPQPLQRRFFTFVQQAPRVLIVGGDQRLAQALPENTAEVAIVSPDQVDQALRTEYYDSVVLSAVAANELGKEAINQIAWQVENEGMGLFLTNGNHLGLGEDAQTVLMSYNDTALETLLPLSSRPRPYQPEAPGRQVVVLIDASGSMGGWRLRKSQEIVSYIIENLLRPRDRLFLLTFSTGARILIENRYMDQTGKYEAINALWDIKPRGGTDPSFALNLLGRSRLRNCGLIFLSDGEFDQVSYRPDCRATVFALGKSTVPESSALWDIADPFPVTEGFNPASIEMPFFQKETRNRFFEKGRFVPMSMDLFLSRNDRLPVPDLPLEGSAVTFAKDTATLIAVRPKLTDPILAYASAGLGEVGVFTGGLQQRWLGSKKGREALSEWVLRTIGFTARDRYHLEVVDLGNQLQVEVTLRSKNGVLPDVNSMQAELILVDQSVVGLSLEANADVPGMFRGRLRLDQVSQPGRAKFVLREAGPEALSRAQSIPFFIPAENQTPTANKAEAYSFGVNVNMLSTIANLTGGMVNPDGATQLFPSTPNRLPPVLLWPWLALLGFVAYLVAIGFQRFSQ